jgi:hypothetical protein
LCTMLHVITQVKRLSDAWPIDEPGFVRPYFKKAA